MAKIVQYSQVFKTGIYIIYMRESNTIKCVLVVEPLRCSFPPPPDLFGSYFFGFCSVHFFLSWRKMFFSKWFRRFVSSLYTVVQWLNRFLISLTLISYEGDGYWKLTGVYIFANNPPTRNKSDPCPVFVKFYYYGQKLLCFTTLWTPPPAMRERFFSWGIKNCIKRRCCKPRTNMQYAFSRFGN